MGKSANALEHVRVGQVAPREAYFQELALFRKANRLCYEHTRTGVPDPEPPLGQIRPVDVYAVVDAALSRIRSVKEIIGIPETVEPQPRDASKTPTDVFSSTMLANQQLNLLLDQQFAPSDVFEQVTLAVGLTSQLLARFPGATRIAPTPAYERGRRPADVYERLVRCFQRVRSIATVSQLDMGTLTRVHSDDPVTPSYVYNMATLVVSELTFVHALIPDASAPVGTYYPGRKLPSHVYQRVGILEAQLAELEKHVREHPGWLAPQERAR
jgi:hypothetical protein